MDKKEKEDVVIEASLMTASVQASGDGTEENPFIISDADGFLRIKDNLSAFYRLSGDIDFEGKTNEPIGNKANPFTGGIDGAGHVVKNFKISGTGNTIGLFGFARSARFRNLRIENAEIVPVSPENNIGALAGNMKECIAENIHLTKITVAGKHYIGGMVGYCYNGMLTECSLNGNISVSGAMYIGGIAGYILKSDTGISKCHVEGNITGEMFVGGLIGWTDATISDCCTFGNVTAIGNDYRTGGLIGFSNNAVIKNCYSICRISRNGYGIVEDYADTRVTNSYFNSILAGTISPSAQARTPEQMLSKETYVGWDFENIWEYREDSSPILRCMEAYEQDSFELIFSNLKYSSVLIEWKDISGAEEYIISYSGKKEKVTVPQIFIENLNSDTEYEFRVKANVGNTTGVWSKILKIKTKRLLLVDGLHNASKDVSTITLTWNQIEDAKSYEVIYNDNILKTNMNMCTLTGLYSDTPYAISIKAFLSDGSTIISEPIVERLYSLNPQTDYAKEFIAKCENQKWFIDEVENLLNRKGKSINTINSRGDLATIYAIGLTGRGISGSIPAAIGELTQLRYLYLADNSLKGKVPEELSLLDKLIEMDLSGNDFSE